MALAQTVQTTGVNWESVGTLIAAIVAAVSFIFGIFARYVSNKITASIDKFRIEVVNQLDTRLTTVETKLDGIKRQNDASNRRRL